MSADLSLIKSSRRHQNQAFFFRLALWFVGQRKRSWARSSLLHRARCAPSVTTVPQQTGACLWRTQKRIFSLGSVSLYWASDLYINNPLTLSFSFQGVEKRHPHPPHYSHLYGAFPRNSDQEWFTNWPSWALLNPFNIPYWRERFPWQISLGTALSPGLYYSGRRPHLVRNYHHPGPTTVFSFGSESPHCSFS